MIERGNAGWPGWLVAAGAFCAFGCGLFVAWAVFAQPVHAEPEQQATPAPAMSSDCDARIAALESAQKLQSDSFETTVLKTRLMSVVDHEGRDRIVMGTVLGEASISIRREDGQSALILKENKGAVSIAFVDQKQQARLTIAVANDHSQIDLLDDQNRNRARIVVTPNGDGNIGVLDAKGKPRAAMIAGETFNGVMLFDEKGNAAVVR